MDSNRPKNQTRMEAQYITACLMCRYFIGVNIWTAVYNTCEHKHISRCDSNWASGTTSLISFQKPKTQENNLNFKSFQLGTGVD